MPAGNDLRARARTVGYYAAPILLALLLYWPSLTGWFQKDDFAWLGLRNLVHGWHDFWWALFTPMAQGTIRTLSERVFFLSFTSMFGLDALPFHGWAFLTFAATLPILSSVCAKITGSRAAGFLAAILWTVNSGLAVALSWTAVYYELLCAFFFVLNFWLLLRHVETGERRFYIAQCATFVLGFGVLELNVVYPALATVYALCRARHILRKVVPLFALSAIYTAVHMAVAPLPAGGPYKTYWDASVIPTLWTYWKWALGPSRLILFGIHPSPMRSMLTVLLTLGLIGFLAWKLYRRQWVAAFFPAWFVIVLAPLLPLRDHISDTYLPVPLIGLAMWGAWGLVSAWRSGLPGKTVAVSLLGIYLCVSVPLTRLIAVSLHDESQRVRQFVLAVAAKAQPGKMLLLKGVDKEMFWSVLYHRGFRLFGIPEVFLVPEDRGSIARDPRLGDPQPFFLNSSPVRRALALNRALVLDVSGGSVRDITAEYRKAANIGDEDSVSSKVDVGDVSLTGQLGSTWYPAEDGFRWMAGRATVTLRGPRGPAEKLYLTGYCPASALKAGPLKMHVSVAGESLAPVWIRQPGGNFSLVLDLPPRMIGPPVVEVAVALARTFFAPPDPRELGLAFGVFEIR